jgi:hypothetical protein
MDNQEKVMIICTRVEENPDPVSGSVQMDCDGICGEKVWVSQSSLNGFNAIKKELKGVGEVTLHPTCHRCVLVRAIEDEEVREELRSGIAAFPPEFENPALAKVRELLGATEITGEAFGQYLRAEMERQAQQENQAT